MEAAISGAVIEFRAPRGAEEQLCGGTGHCWTTKPEEARNCALERRRRLNIYHPHLGVSLGSGLCPFTPS